MNSYLRYFTLFLLFGTTEIYPKVQDKVLPIYPSVMLSQKELHENQHVRDAKLAQAAKDGHLYLEMPAGAIDKLPIALEFAHSWYTNEDIKHYPLKGLSGIKDANLCQAEHLICEREYWNGIYSEELRTMSNLLIDEATCILEKLFPLVVPQLSKALWNKAAPGLFDKTGSYFLTFNHYRSHKNTIGLK